MKNKLIGLSLVMFSIATSAIADHIELTMNGVKIPITNAAIVLQAGPTGELTILSINGGSSPVIPGPITPGPVIPVPTTDLASSVIQASAGVAAYANKDQDRAAMAYVMTFLAPGVQKAEINLGRKTIKDACDSACGTNASKWNNLHAVIASNTASMSNIQYAASLKIIADALTSDLAASSDDYVYAGGAVDAGQFGSFSEQAINELMSASDSGRFGKLLPEGFLAQLLQMLLPILLKMLLGI